MPPKADRLLFIALILAVLFHGSALLYNLDKSYDAFVHIFFADHYARSWFEPWEYRWYTGFPTTSYPPLSHQLIALLSFVGGLKFGFIVVIISFLCFFVIGIYRFSQLFVSKRSAGYASLFAVVASSIVQTIHIYGQLPTIIGISCLVNALPVVYTFFRTGRKKYLILSLSILGVTVASHHVTTIFGIIFFIAPLIATALLDEAGYSGNFFKVALSIILLAIKKIRLFIFFFPALVIEIVCVIFPYWYWSKTDPITQVPIPHGSRDSFIKVTSSGMMFFIIPLGFTLIMLPYIFRSLYTRRNIFVGLSFSLLFLLGTGGTTPLPKMILGANAFNILTLDRFTFWASVLAIPFIGDFFRKLVEGDIRERIINRYGKKMYHLTSLVLIFPVIFQGLFIINYHKYRTLQPQSIDMQPIVNFLQMDQHSRWRFMTLGFGDQMAWLSCQTTACSIDGNYHSARRVPEMTSQPLERLENSKFKGIQGIGSLQQFLAIPEKYYLKFVFSNDKFYDPILYFAGWERVQRLENGIMVWQKLDVPELPSVLPKREIPEYQKIMWGTLPIFTLFIMIIILLFNRRYFLLNPFEQIDNIAFNPAKHNRWLFIWAGILLLVSIGFGIKSMFISFQKDPIILLKAYYNALDFKYFKESHSYFEPNSINYDEYVLRLSVKDGLLASYAKLDSFSTSIEKRSDKEVHAIVKTEWITPLERYYVESEHTLIKINDNWFIKPPIFDKTIAPNEHIEKGIVVFHSQGKRNVTTAGTDHDDVLDRPELFVLSSKLVKVDGQFIVVGEIQNIDHQPAHLTIEARLYDSTGRKLVAYNAKYTTIHEVLPKEVVPFRIEFEETAWIKNDDLRPLRFDPKEFTAISFSTPPKGFKLLARAVVADRDLYRDAGVQNIQVHNQITADVYNFGIEEISVPQVLFTYYDQDSTVRWVDDLFLKDGVRQQASASFRKKLPLLKDVEIIKVGKQEDFYINGLPQLTFKNHYRNTVRPGLMCLPSGREYIRLLLNCYIGNPTIY